MPGFTKSTHSHTSSHHQQPSPSSSSSHHHQQPPKASTSSSSTRRHQPSRSPPKSIVILSDDDEEDTPPPPPPQKSKKERFDGDPRFHLNAPQDLHQPRPNSSSSRNSGRNNLPSSSNATSQGQAQAEDDDETDEDEELPLRLRGGGGDTDGDVEDLCLVCEEGSCRCGGAKGAGVYKRSPELGAAQGTTKLKLSLNSAAPSSAAVTKKTATPPRRGRPSTRKERSSTSLNNKEYQPRTASTHSTSGSGSGTTPSRMSLRQVLAQSAKEAEEYFSSHSRGSDTNSVSTIKDKDRKKNKSKKGKNKRKVSIGKNISDVSEFELDFDDDIEREEEDALREEYELRMSDESSEMSDSDSQESEETTEDEKTAGRRRTRDDSILSGGEDLDVDLFDLDHDEDDEDGNGDLTITDLPLVGTHGVVTWSDYDNSVLSSSSSSSSSEDDDEDEEGEDEHVLSKKQAAREFENELEALLKLSEAVHGPVQADEYDLGEMWFEEISDSDDSDSDSRDGDDESDGNDQEEEFGSDLEDGRKLLVDGWGMSTDDDDTDSDLFYEGPYQGSDNDMEDQDGGDTTDSLDSDDHDGLVRFGIECDSSSSDTSASSHRQQHPFGTASLADVQAPTSADLASLPQYLFINRRISLQDLNDDPDRTMMEIAGTEGATPSHKNGSASDEMLNTLLSSSTGRRRRMPEIEEEDEDEEEEGTKRRSKRAAKKRKVAVPETAQGPAMGVWAPKEKARAVVIDESDTLAPSPFAKKKRRGRQLLDGTPARRLRADSKVSTTSGPSVTDGSISGELPDMASPFLPDVALDFDLNDVLHASLLHSGASSQSGSSDDTDDEEQIAIGLADLSRWSRIPIGAFRSSTVLSPQASLPLPADDRLGLQLLQSDRRHRNGTSMSHTLSSPHASVRLTKRAIEKRMLTSPVFGPVPTPSGLDSPKSRRIRRKEKKEVLNAATPVPKTRGRSQSTASIGTVKASSPSILAAPPSDTVPALHSPLFQSHRS